MNKEAQVKVQKYHQLEYGGRVFLPQWRMRRRRWEESIAQSRCKREGIKFKMQPFSCLCGSINCLGDFLICRPEKKEPPKVEKKPRRLSLIEGRYGFYSIPIGT